MAVYLPEKVYAVCTNQMNPDPRQLLLSDLRESFARTVKFGSKDKVFLVKIDKKLTEDFKCKSNWSTGAGMVALGAGVGVGLGIAAVCMTVPVAGWIVGGAIAIGSLVWGIWKMSQRPSCSEMIGFEESKWTLHHSTVRFDSGKISVKELHLALTKNSMLTCKEGGVVLPFINQADAMSAAGTIAGNNKTEFWTNVAGGFLTGALLGFGMGIALPAGAALTWGQGTMHALSQAAIFGLWIPVGQYVITPLAIGFGVKTNEFLADGDSYTNVKDIQQSTEDPMLPTDNWDAVSPAKDINDIRNKLIQNRASKADIAKFEAGIAEAKKQGSYSLKNNPDLKEMFERMKAGEFGKELQERVTNKSGNFRGKVNEKNASKSAENHSQKATTSINENNRANIRSGLTATGGILTLIAPFAANFFAERAIRLAAEGYTNDNTKGVTVSATDA
ncbi:hypothetical protein [Chryseobacterium pennipullorum]|uniref:DUF4280 domain-containing protein n=1 Tax=Chryseobacterium pennipullorum TaxID=2258963 RepID=A0A3D9AKY2_9FLAO|nr:hypothetical protein [Chryseobacterium pennipullorum]REC41994.1 hypothetical protein DRF67_20880 [Chryseobacterium pennipullorum]